MGVDTTPKNFVVKVKFMAEEMNPYERFVALAEHKDIDRIPSLNHLSSVTIPLMRKYNVKWPEAHFDPAMMTKLAEASWLDCKLEGMCVPFDLVVEAEPLGAVCDYHPDKILWPSCISRPEKWEPKDLKIPDDPQNQMRIPVICKALNMLHEKYYGKVPVVAYINCPYTSYSSYVGETTDVLIWCRTNPEKIHEMWDVLIDYYIDIANIFREAGADMITLREEGTSSDNMSPKHFRELIKPYLTEMIKRIKKPNLLHICGLTTPIIGDMIECGANMISFEERTKTTEGDEERNKKCAELGIPRYPIGGNLSAFGLLKEGPAERVNGAVRRLLQQGIDFTMPGCDWYIEIPIEHMCEFVNSTIQYSPEAISKFIKR